MSTFSTRPGRWALRAAASCVVVSQLVAPFGSIAQAQSTPKASDKISSFATASFVNANGEQKSAQSNTVETIVQQVGAFSLSPNGTVYGAPGSEVTVSHYIKNEGNGTDRFVIKVQDPRGGTPYLSSIDVLPGQGKANTGAPSLLTTPSSGPVTNGTEYATAPIPIAAGETYHYVVIYKIPADAPTSPTPWTTKGNVSVTAENTGIDYVSQTLASEDTINVSTAAAFNSTVTAAPNSGKVNGTSTYTLNYDNKSGVDKGDMYLRAELPAGLVYTPGSVRWANAIVPNEDGSLNTAPADKITFKVTGGNVIEALVKDVPVGQESSITFQVSVAANAALGLHNGAYKFSQLSCSVADITAANAGAGCSTMSTAAALPFTVLPTNDVQLGSVDDPASLTDVVTAPRGVPGGVVAFEVDIANQGNATDTFELTVDSVGSTFPAGTTFRWADSDKLSPLQNTFGVSTPSDPGTDTGPMLQGTTKKIYLLATLPANTPVDVGLNYQVKVTATSSTDVNESDTAFMQLTDVVAGYVDVTSSAAGSTSDIGPGANLSTGNVSQTLSIVAGGTAYTSSDAANAAAGHAVFDLYIRNNDSAAATFDFSHSTTTTFPGNLPAGYTVDYYAYDTSVAQSLTGLKITQITVGAASQSRAIAVVTPPVSAPAAAAQEIYFRVRGTANSVLGGSIASDYIKTTLAVSTASTKSFSLSPTGATKQVGPGNPADFLHTMTNTGSQSCGATTGLIVTPGMSSAAYAAGWSMLVYEDKGTLNQFDNSDVLIARYNSTDGLVAGSIAGGLTSGASKPLLVRVYAPSNASDGASASFELKIEDTDGTPNCGSQTVLDAVTVSTSQLSVLKLQSLDTACSAIGTPTSSSNLQVKPGQCIWYEATVTNNGAAAVSNVMLKDLVPAYTTLQSGTASCDSKLLDPIATLDDSVTGVVRCGGAANTLNSTGTITLKFQVKVVE